MPPIAIIHLIIILESALRPSDAGRVSTYDTLLRQVWGGRGHGDPKLVRAIVKRLRRKLGDDAANPAYIFNERGVGYRIARPGEP